MTSQLETVSRVDSVWDMYPTALAGPVGGGGVAGVATPVISQKNSGHPRGR